MYLIKKKHKEEYISSRSPNGHSILGSYYWNTKANAIKFSLKEMKSQWGNIWGRGSIYPNVGHTEIQIIELEEIKTYSPPKRAINLK